MAKNRLLTQAEMNDLFHIRLTALETVLCETLQGFASDLENIGINEVDNDMTAEEKANVKAELRQIRKKYKVK